MVVVSKKSHIVDHYMFLCYSALYAAAVDENGIYGSLSHIMSISPYENGKLMVPYEDYYCNDKVQAKIIADLLEEPYCILGHSAIHKLKKREKESIRCSVVLGASPFTSKKTFLKNHPKFRDVYDKVP